MPGDRTSAKISTNQTIISVQCKFFFSKVIFSLEQFKQE